MKRSIAKWVLNNLSKAKLIAKVLPLVLFWKSKTRNRWVRETFVLSSYKILHECQFKAFSIWCQRAIYEGCFLSVKGLDFSARGLMEALSFFQLLMVAFFPFGNKARKDGQSDRCPCRDHRSNWFEGHNDLRAQPLWDESLLRLRFFQQYDFRSTHQHKRHRGNEAWAQNMSRRKLLESSTGWTAQLGSVG